MTTTLRTRLLMAAPLLAVAFLAAYDPSENGPTLCPFALATGTACPGCGMTRAFGYLARGDLFTALRYHPLVLLIAIQGVAGWGWFALRSRRDLKPIPSRLTSAILVGTAISLIVVWMLRLWAGGLPPV